MKPTRRIAFLTPQGSHPTNASVVESLSNEFSRFDIDVIRVWPDIIRARSFYYPLNLLCATFEHGRRLIWQAPIYSLDDYLMRTTYLFKRIKARVARLLNDTDYAFSFQMQSLFDLSVPHIPHFVYTDHTVLANLEFPIVNTHDVHFKWLECERTIYQNARLTFVRSNHVRRSIIEQYGGNPAKVALVYAGSNVKVDPQQQPNHSKYASKTILFVGMDWERKGGPELVEAFKQVLQVHPDARLLIVGCSPQVNVPNCTVLGKVPKEELHACYEQAAIFCLPTRREPFGIVFVEAFMHRLPIVTLNLGAAPDLVVPDQSGYLVEYGQIDKLAAALIDLLEHPDRCAAFGEHGYRLASDRYTWQHTGARIREHIEHALDGHLT